MRVADAHRQLQGPRRQRHAVAASGTGRLGGVGGQLRQRWRRHLCLRRGRRHGRHHHGPRLDLPRQAGADARARRHAGTGAGHPPGHLRRRRPSRRRHLLCQPQLAPVLPARHQDAGLRALGGPRLSRARQRHHPVRCRLQRARLRDRLLRIATRGGDRRPPAHLRRPAGQLRADRRRLPGRHRHASPHRPSPPPSPRAPPSPNRSACARCSACCGKQGAARSC